MSRKRCTPEQIIGKLREAEVLLSQGQKTGEVCRRVVRALEQHDVAPSLDAAARPAAGATSDSPRSISSKAVLSVASASFSPVTTFIGRV